MDWGRGKVGVRGVQLRGGHFSNHPAERSVFYLFVMKPFQEEKPILGPVHNFTGTSRVVIIWINADNAEEGDFRVAFRLCFKASPSAKPFIWKLVLFTCK